jgi:hypothetical protein
MNKVIKAFKHLFVPHVHNDYKPHFFRELSILSITIVVVILLFLSAGSILYIKNTNMTATVLPAVLVDLTNTARTANSEQALTRNSTLDEAARMKAEDMANLGYFAHTSPSGITPWHWFDQAGYYFIYAGENLAINFTESTDLESAWLDSPTHRANILNSRFTEIGIATKDGIYQGRPTTFVVQMFGTPSIPIPTVESKVSIPLLIKKSNTKTTPKTQVATALTPAVKGESIVQENNLETVVDTKDFISVKNNDASKSAEAVGETPHYSSWYQRFIFMTPEYTDRIYKVMIWFVLVALLIMTVMEIRIQRPKNIIYGVLLLVIILCLIYVNKSMFMTSFLV